VAARAPTRERNTAAVSRGGERSHVRWRNTNASFRVRMSERKKNAKSPPRWAQPQREK